MSGADLVGAGACVPKQPSQMEQARDELKTVASVAVDLRQEVGSRVNSLVGAQPCTSDQGEDVGESGCVAGDMLAAIASLRYSLSEISEATRRL